MAMKYDTRSCTITTTWEWVQVLGSGGSKNVTVNNIAVSASQQWAWDGAYWNPVGSMVVDTSSHYYSDSDGYTGYIPLISHNATVEAPTYSGTRFDQRVTTYGGGTGTFSGTVTKSYSYQWSDYSTTDNASYSISYDDGTYAGTLTLDSVSGSPSSPSYSGSYSGQTTTTSTSGTAYYSGDVPLKPTAPSSPTNFRVSSQNDTSVNLAWDSVSGADSYSVEVYIKGNGVPIQTSYGLTSLTKYFDGLSKGQTYSFKLWAKNGAGNGAAVNINDFLLGGGRPQNWTWTTLLPTANTYTIDKHRANLVSANDWNDFCARINDFRKYKNLATVSFTSAVAANDFKSTLYEQARSAIDAMKVSTNPNGYYSKLVVLRETLNSIS
jgi:hypothetical protein